MNKANQDADSGQQASTTSKSGAGQFKAMDSGSKAPKQIQDVCKAEVYVSDADEPFEEVSLKWNSDGGLPDESKSAKFMS